MRARSVPAKKEDLPTPEPEKDITRQDRSGSRGKYRKREELDDQGGSHVGAQHHRQGRNQTDDLLGDETGRHESGSRAALEQSRDQDAGQKRAPATAERSFHQKSEARAERALQACAHHPDPPEQERGQSGEIDKSEAELHKEKTGGASFTSRPKLLYEPPEGRTATPFCRRKAFGGATGRSPGEEGFS